jgi:hypothetical protein
MNEEMIYTQEMKSNNRSMQIGMLYLDENDDECELLGENNQEQVYIGRPTSKKFHRRYLSVTEKSRVNPVKSNEEIETEQLKRTQCDKVDAFLRAGGHYRPVGLSKYLQDGGFLAEIIRPLKK